MITADVEGLELTLRGLDAFGVRVRAYAMAGVIEGLKVAQQASVKMISAADHSLATLAAMHHPYSAKHPAPPHGDPVIHAQTGAYLAALTVNNPKGAFGAILEGSITIEGGLKDLDRWLQDGTSKMIARPWMQFVAQTFGNDILAVVRARIEQGLDAERAS